jgi:hypothetical protein
MRSPLLMIAVMAGGVLPHCGAWADGVDAAFRLCAVFERTGLISKCEVDGWGSTVDIKMDRSSSEARKICSGAADIMGQPSSFGGRWKLRIFSPYSGDQPIATCNLY